MRFTYNVLYSFKGTSGDGEYPYAGLINVNGTLYSTTQSGGANSEGTVFSITPSGKETVLHSFGGSADGEYPFAGLINVKGTLYGTTEVGGANGDGTVFSITPSGTETVLYSFKGGSGDGEQPLAGLINVKGTLYSMTDEGGANSEGTVFSITPSGTETVLHSFGGSGDGAYPDVASLLNVQGKLYATTLVGGANGDGTVFSITPSGTETVLYSFKGGSGDGDLPFAGLINVMGTLYGTTYFGGSGPCSISGSSGCGTIFSITPSGTETVLYSFKGDPGDGEYPEAGLGLVNAKGKLYGTTSAGGTLNEGTIFSITPSGTETVLHSFGGSGDGENPLGGLNKVKGWLYGTAYSAGANGYGTVFRQKP